MKALEVQVKGTCHCCGSPAVFCSLPWPFFPWSPLLHESLSAGTEVLYLTGAMFASGAEITVF